MSVFVPEAIVTAQQLKNVLIKSKFIIKILSTMVPRFVTHA